MVQVWFLPLEAKWVKKIIENRSKLVLFFFGPLTDQIKEPYLVHMWASLRATYVPSIKSIACG